ncbi:MAG: hypothetical protein ACRETI_01320 [Steroidobacteraceae bacterium]
MVAKQLGTAALAAIVCAITLAGTARACGDKLVALGGGVGFQRVMVSRNPGHVMMLLEPATGLAAANDRFNLVASLSLAGHEVSVVKNADELRAKRDAVAPDLILVDATRATQLQSQPAAGGKAPMIMPVAYSAGAGELTPTQRPIDCVTVVGGRKGAQLLKAVEHALKLRSRGLPMPCDKSTDSHQA